MVGSVHHSDSVPEVMEVIVMAVVIRVSFVDESEELVRIYLVVINYLGDAEHRPHVFKEVFAILGLQVVKLKVLESIQIKFLRVSTLPILLTLKSRSVMSTFSSLYIDSSLAPNYFEIFSDDIAFFKTLSACFTWIYGSCSWRA